MAGLPGPYSRWRWALGHLGSDHHGHLGSVFREAERPFGKGQPQILDLLMKKLVRGDWEICY